MSLPRGMSAVAENRVALSAQLGGSDDPARPCHKANAELTFKLDYWMGASRARFFTKPNGL
jgi:hypothetical protein